MASFNEDGTLCCLGGFFALFHHANCQLQLHECSGSEQIPGSKFDHYPVMLNVEYRLEFSSPEQDQHTAWDRDALVAAAISKTSTSSSNNSLKKKSGFTGRSKKPKMLGELHGASLVQELGLADVFTGGLRTTGLLTTNGMKFLQHLLPKVDCILVRLNLHSRWKRTKLPTLRHISATLLKPCRTWLISGGLLYATFPFESRLRLGRKAVEDSGDEVFAAIGEPLL